MPGRSPRLTALAVPLAAAVLATSACTSKQDAVTTALPATTQASQGVPSAEPPASTPAPSTPASSSPGTSSEAPTSELATSDPASTPPSGGRSSQAPSSQPPSSPSATASTPVPSVGLRPDPTAGPRTKGFGTTTTYADKSAIAVSAPVTTTVGGTTYATVVVTVHNGTNAPVPAAYWWVEALVDGQVVQPHVDEARGLVMPSGDVPAGGNRSFTMAFEHRPGQTFAVRVTWRDGFPFVYGG